MANLVNRSATDHRFQQRLEQQASLKEKRSTVSNKSFYGPAITRLILETQKKEAAERKKHVAPNTQVIPVVNIRSGSQHFMVPEPPEKIWYKEPVEQTLALKKLYRTLFVFTVICQTALTLVQLLFWVEFIYTWPVDFIQDLINIPFPTFGSIIRELTFCLALHPILNAALGMLAIFCCRDKCLHTYFLRCTLFCFVTAAVMVVAIDFISLIPSINIKPLLNEGIDLYDLHNSTTLEAKWLAKAKHYHRAWDVMQEELKCCGVDHYGDWVSQRQTEPVKVPKSCCRAFRFSVERNTIKRDPHYEEDQEYCQKFPSPVNTWDIGCLQIFFDFVTQISTGFVISQLVDIILVVTSSILAMLYHTSRIQELDTDYDYTMGQYFIDCCCCTRCIKTKKKLTDAEIQQIKEDHHWKHTKAERRRSEDDFHVYHQHSAGSGGAEEAGGKDKQHRGPDSPVKIMTVDEVYDRRVSRHSRKSVHSI